MNPEQTRRKCKVCGETEPSFIHAVSKGGVFRRLCTDCLLKEHRELFCPICLDVFVSNSMTPPDACIICRNCPSIIHLSCSLPQPSSAAASSSAPNFTCPPCSDPNFSFFPKSRSHQNGENDADGSGTLLDIESTKALVAAARISVVSTNKAADNLRKEAVKKILEAKTAKIRAKEALGNLQDLVLRQKTLHNHNPNKRKNSDR